MFWVEGWHAGAYRRVTWHEGVLGGDDLVQYRLRAFARTCEAANKEIGFPDGPRLWQNYLADPFVALALIGLFFDYRLRASGGERPMLPDIPVDAIP